METLRKYSCPYCHGALSAPTRKKTCPHCGKTIYARTKSSGEHVWATEEQLETIKKEWELHWQKEIFKQEAASFRSPVYKEFGALIARSKQALKAGERDEAWRLANLALLKAGEKSKDSRWAERFREVYALMATQLAIEERYSDSLIFFASEIYWACFSDMLSQASYQQILQPLSADMKQAHVQITLDPERTLPPFILRPIITAMQFSGITLIAFEALFLKQAKLEETLARKFLPVHERFRFDIPAPEIIWGIASVTSFDLIWNYGRKAIFLCMQSKSEVVFFK